MMIYVFRTIRALGTSSGRRMLAGRALVATVVLSLLLIPATCAQMAGPHSIFTDPMAGHAHHHHHAPAAAKEPVGFASVDHLTWHIVNGDGSPGWAVMDDDESDEDCPPRPALRDLPTTMSMNANNATLSLDPGYELELPMADEPLMADAPVLTATTIQVELPPPR